MFLTGTLLSKACTVTLKKTYSAALSILFVNNKIP